MKWREILDLALSGTGVGGSPDALSAQKWQVFMSEANKRLHDYLTVSECYLRTTIPVTPNQDWVPQPALTHSIKNIQNRTGGHKLRKEPEGSLGRMRFFESTKDMPPKRNIESVNFYWREGGKIWLRDTPNEAGVLDVEYKYIPEDLTVDDLDLEPQLPGQYHVSIADMYVAVYYTFHPPLDPASSSPMLSYGPNRAQSVINQIEGHKTEPKAEEDLDSDRVIYQPGYTMGGIR